MELFASEQEIISWGIFCSGVNASAPHNLGEETEGDIMILLKELGSNALLALPGLAIVLGYTVLLWWTINRITKFNDEKELFDKKNYAFLLQRTAIVAAQIIAMLAVLPDYDVEAPLASSAWLALEGLWVFVAILAARFIVDWAILPKTNNTELIRDGNMAMATVEASFYIGVGFLLKGSLTGTASSNWLSLASTVVFYIAGVLFVIGVFYLHELITKYDMRGRLREGNMTTALDAASILLGVSVVTSVGVAGDFTGWWIGFRAFFVTALISVIMLYVLRWVVDLVIIKGHTVRTIQDTNNVPAAALLAASLVMLALLISNVMTYVIW